MVQLQARKVSFLLDNCSDNSIYCDAYINVIHCFMPPNSTYALQHMEFCDDS